MVHEIVQCHVSGDRDLNMQRLELEALQEATEAVLVHLLECSNMIARNAHRVTVMPRQQCSILL